jgi:hypothetical protein
MKNFEKKSQQMRNIKDTLSWGTIKGSWLSPITIWCIYSQIFSKTHEKHNKTCNKIIKKFDRKFTK